MNTVAELQAENTKLRARLGLTPDAEIPDETPAPGRPPAPAPPPAAGAPSKAALAKAREAGRAAAKKMPDRARPSDRP